MKDEERIENQILDAEVTAKDSDVLKQSAICLVLAVTSIGAIIYFLPKGANYILCLNQWDALMGILNSVAFLLSCYGVILFVKNLKGTQSRRFVYLVVFLINFGIALISGLLTISFLRSIFTWCWVWEAV